MRKIILLAAFAFVATTSFGQTEKGDWMVGGYFRLNTAKNNTQIGLSPTAGAFVINNLAIGANLLLDHSKFGDNKRTDFGIGPFVRYYFTKADVRPILHGSLNFMSSRNRTATESSTESGINYFLGGGASIFLNDQVSLDGLIGYQHSKLKGIDGSGGFAVNIGFQVYLHKKQVDKLRGNKDSY